MSIVIALGAVVNSVFAAMAPTVTLIETGSRPVESSTVMVATPAETPLMVICVVDASTPTRATLVLLLLAVYGKAPPLIVKVCVPDAPMVTLAGAVVCRTLDEPTRTLTVTLLLLASRTKIVAVPPATPWIVKVVPLMLPVATSGSLLIAT